MLANNSESGEVKTIAEYMTGTGASYTSASLLSLVHSLKRYYITVVMASPLSSIVAELNTRKHKTMDFWLHDGNP